MNNYQLINGIPTPIPAKLEKVNFDKVRAILAADPHHQLLGLGFTQKQAFILELSRAWEEVKQNLCGSNKEAILKIANKHRITL